MGTCAPTNHTVLGSKDLYDVNKLNYSRYFDNISISSIKCPLRNLNPLVLIQNLCLIVSRIDSIFECDCSLLLKFGRAIHIRHNILLYTHI